MTALLPTLRRLRSTILPREAKIVSGCTEDLTGEIAQALLPGSCYYSLFVASGSKFALVIFFVSCRKAGARALAVKDQSKAQEREIEELKKDLAQWEDDLKVAWETCDLYLVDFQKCDRDSVLTEDQATRAEEDPNTQRATRAQEVEGALKAGYENGWDAAEAEYKKQVQEVEGTLPKTKLLGQTSVWP
ncbi:hypothetical protein RHMOL_Rhmol05G0159200 [Rhododendron molle]|uniref:Uncharacterized protein n=1 Tax=Rhododendron molle TaxID=49168 RepID=A0ACC0NPR9_RHOML|nr:hypothetical protein RHMOL_Rhmol05G0159200 [Rhododendron molle]